MCYVYMGLGLGLNFNLSLFYFFSLYHLTRTHTHSRTFSDSLNVHACNPLTTTQTVQTRNLSRSALVFLVASVKTVCRLYDTL
jgi:hypothetical protein